MSYTQRFLSVLFVSAIGVVCVTNTLYAVLDTGIGADGIAGQAAASAGYGQADQFTLSIIVGMVVRFLFGFLGLLFTLLMLYAGYNWMTAQGDSSKVETAQNTMQQSIIGMVVCFSAYAISSLVIRTFFGG